MIENLHQIKEFGLLSLMYIQNNNFSDFGKLMHEHWMYKKNRSKFITNNEIDTYYDYGIKNGAFGGKLIGAGGGGFLMFYTEDSKFLENKFKKIGLKKLDYQFDFEGNKLVAK
jgi:D-glycero-alpha-D-manno-heptose-7-phosphate kinase